MQLNRSIYKEYKTYKERIIQFGEGNFLRAFVDWIIDEMNEKVGFNSSVAVVQPLENGRAEELNQQDCLYTLYLNGIKNNKPISEHKIINSISRGINPYKNYEEYIKLAENPDLRFIISNTTEAGISYSEGDTLNKIQKSYPAKLTALLYHRFKAFNGSLDKGLIIIPCELIDNNGVNLKKFILQYSNEWNLENDFCNWIDQANTFCNTLVDRIVPGYPKDKIDEITKELGYTDMNLVEGEQFHLWVIEGPDWIKNEFPADKANLNVIFTDNQKPYRTRKVRILNGAHTVMTPVAYLYGIETVKEAIENDIIGKFVRQTIFDEIIPTLDLPSEELIKFANDVIDRFRNPYIKHFLMSISLNSMSKYETRVLPSLLKYVEQNKSLPKHLVFSLASMIVFYRGDIDVKDSGDIIALYKNAWGLFDGTKESICNVVKNILGYKDNWKMDLNEINGLSELTTEYVYSIITDGIKNAINTI